MRSAPPSTCLGSAASLSMLGALLFLVVAASSAISHEQQIHNQNMSSALYRFLEPAGRATVNFFERITISAQNVDEQLDRNHPPTICSGDVQNWSNGDQYDVCWQWEALYGNKTRITPEAPNAAPTDRPSSEPSLSPNHLSSVANNTNSSSIVSQEHTSLPINQIPTSQGAKLVNVTAWLTTFSLNLTFATARRLRHRSPGGARDLSISYESEVLRNATEIFLDEIYASSYSPYYSNFSLYMVSFTGETSGSSFLIISNKFTGALTLLAPSDNSYEAPSQENLTSVTLQAFVGNRFLNILHRVDDAVLSSADSVTVTQSTESGIGSATDKGTDTASANMTTGGDVSSATQNSSRTVTMIAGSGAAVALFTAIAIILSKKHSSQAHEDSDGIVNKLDKRRGPVLSTMTMETSPRSNNSHEFIQELEDQASVSNEGDTNFLSKLDSYSCSSDLSGVKYSKSSAYSVSAYSMEGFDTDDLCTVDTLRNSNVAKSTVIQGIEYSDDESVSNMSAMDDVRLHSVLQLEEEMADENEPTQWQAEDIVHVNRADFASVWNGNKGNDTVEPEANKSNRYVSNSYNCLDTKENVKLKDCDEELNADILPEKVLPFPTLFTLGLLQGATRSLAPEAEHEARVDRVDFAPVLNGNKVNDTTEPETDKSDRYVSNSYSCLGTRENVELKDGGEELNADILPEKAPTPPASFTLELLQGATRSIAPEAEHVAHANRINFAPVLNGNKGDDTAELEADKSDHYISNSYSCLDTRKKDESEDCGEESNADVLPEKAPPPPASFTLELLQGVSRSFAPEDNQSDFDDIETDYMLTNANMLGARPEEEYDGTDYYGSAADIESVVSNRNNKSESDVEERLDLIDDSDGDSAVIDDLVNTSLAERSSLAEF